MAIPVTIKIDNHIVLTPTLLNAKLDALGHKPPVCSFMEFHDTFQFVDGGWITLLMAGFPTTGDPANPRNGWIHQTSARAWFTSEGWTS